MKPEPIKLTKRQARAFILKHQNLHHPRTLTGKEGAFAFIRRVNAIQFDPLNMVGHNPHLVLQSRVKDYKPSFLEALLYEDRQLLDGWDKNMCIYPVEDRPYFQRYRDRQRAKYQEPSNPVHQALEEVRIAIDTRGPLSSIDLALNEKVQWPWAPTKLSRATLESLYFGGELIIHHKVGTRKVYDFAHKHLPAEVLNSDDPNTSSDTYYQWYAKRRVESVGLLWNRASDAWLEIRGFKSAERNAAFDAMEERGELIRVAVESIRYPFYLLEEERGLLEEVLKANTSNGESCITSSKVSFLAPLDNMLWDRKLIKELFDFEYRWEVYKPAAEREYGYYVLPVLYGDRFVGRFEPKYHRKTGVLEILNWWWEPDATITEALEQAVADAIEDFNGYLDANKIAFSTDSKTGENLEWLSAVLGL